MQKQCKASIKLEQLTQREVELEAELEELEAACEELEAELYELGTDIKKVTREIEYIRKTDMYTYGAGVAWNGIHGVVLGILGNCVEIVFKGNNRFFEERVKIDDPDLSSIGFIESAVLFREFREQGALNMTTSAR